MVQSLHLILVWVVWRCTVLAKDPREGMSPPLGTARLEENKKAVAPWKNSLARLGT